MTNHWNDLANSDCLMIIGCNPAENHPISFKWITKAQEKGAKLIVVDPRFTRSAAKADIYVRLRPGTDIALMGGLINYVLANNLFHQDYVVNYTNAAFVINKDFAFHEGLFSGYQKDKRAYDVATWDYEADKDGKPVTDPTLNHPHCVFQLMKALYARYTPEMVAATTGVPKEVFLKLAAAYGATGQVGKSGTLLYAMGGTQHSTGVQIIRGYTILQLLLGNMGVAGGGINALRGENNVQGSTDMALLFNLVPGYMSRPHGSGPSHPEGLSGQGDPQGQLLDQQTQVLRQPPQGLLGRRRQKRERLCLRLSSQGRQRLPGGGLLLDSPVRGHGRRHHQGDAGLGHEPGGERSQPDSDLSGPGQAGVAGGLRPLGDGHLGLLEAARGQPQGHQDRGLPVPRGGLPGEGRQRLQQRPLAPVALPGGQAPRRRQERSLVRQPPGPGVAEAL